MSTCAGRWHGLNRYFGLHYDLHAGHGDTELGLRAKPQELARMFKLAAVDFVQTDCKGHPGHTSWFSKTRGASVPPKLKADALKGWREGTRRLKLPLHCHYSGIWDMAAGAKHPDWTRIGSDGKSDVVAGQPGLVGSRLGPLPGSLSRNAFSSSSPPYEPLAVGPGDVLYLTADSALLKIRFK